MPEESNIKQLLSSVTDAVDDDFEDFKPVKSCADKLNVKPSYLILPAIVLILIIAVLTSVFAHYAITLFALIYPSYMSFKVSQL